MLVIYQKYKLELEILYERNVSQRLEDVESAPDAYFPQAAQYLVIGFTKINFLSDFNGHVLVHNVFL